jgi:hypothetical protein
MDNYKLGDVVEMRKKHPCGGNEWEITRYGADVKIKCLKCHRIVMLDRVQFKKRVKNKIEAGIN